MSRSRPYLLWRLKTPFCLVCELTAEVLRHRDIFYTTRHLCHVPSPPQHETWLPAYHSPYFANHSQVTAVAPTPDPARRIALGQQTGPG